MAFFNVYSESAIQDPTNVGNDLDQIENDVFESRDELTNVSTDPVEEAFIIMYESEYNFNQIMRAIGIAELNEAANGREFFLEGANAKAFFEKIKTGLKKMFERITQAVKKVLHKLDFAVKSDKKFISENKSKIEKGAKGNWSYQGYKYIDLLDSAKQIFGTKDIDLLFKTCEEGEKALGETDDTADAEVFIDHLKEIRVEALDGIIDLNGSDREWSLQNIDMSATAEKVALKLRNGAKEKKELKGYIDINKDVIDVLKSDRDTTKIRDIYNKCKKVFNETIGKINKAQVRLASKSDAKSTTIANLYSFACRLAEKELSLNNLAYSHLMKAAREKRAQARAVAHVILRYYDDHKKELNESASYNNNTRTVFDGVVIK